MNRLGRLHQNFSRHLLLFAGMALSLYFSYHTVYGERSYAHLLHLNTVAMEKGAALQDVSAERAALERHVKMMRPETLSMDLLEERARTVLGYKHPDEFLVFRN